MKAHPATNGKVIGLTPIISAKFGSLVLAVSTLDCRSGRRGSNPLRAANLSRRSERGNRPGLELGIRRFDPCRLDQFSVEFVLSGYSLPVVTRLLGFESLAPTNYGCCRDRWLLSGGCNPPAKARGSIPSCIHQFARIAQLVEQRPCKAQVIRSNRDYGHQFRSCTWEPECS